MKDQAVEATIAAVASKVAPAGGLTAFLGGLAANDVAAYGGLTVAILSAVVSWYYKRKANRRAEELHHAQLRNLEADQ